MCVSLTDSAPSVTACAERLGCAPYGRHTLIRCAHPSGQPAAVTPLRYVSLLAQERCAKEGHPDIRVSLRETSLAPALLRGPAYMGHPWPITALAASMPLNPFHGDSTRPPEGDLDVVCTIAVEEQRQRPDAANFNSAKITQARDLVPFRRPSRGFAQGERAAWMRRDTDGGPPGAAPERGNAAKRSNSRRLARRVGAANQGVAPVRAQPKRSVDSVMDSAKRYAHKLASPVSSVSSRRKCEEPYFSP